MQSRLGSFLESLANILIGYGIALVSQILIFPLFGVFLPLSVNLWIGLWFTLISLVRSYCLRRWFNGRFFQVASSAHSHPRPHRAINQQY